MNKRIDIEVRELLGRRKGDWLHIAGGSGVSYSWLSKFFNGKIENPGFMTLTKLRDFLKGKKANVCADPLAHDSEGGTPD